MLADLKIKIEHAMATTRQKYVYDLLTEITKVYYSGQSIVIQFIVGKTTEYGDEFIDNINVSEEDEFLVISRQSGLILLSITVTAEELKATLEGWKLAKPSDMLIWWTEGENGNRVELPIVLMNYVFMDVLDPETGQERENYPSYSLGVPTVYLEEDFSIVDALRFIPEDVAMDDMATFAPPPTMN